MLVRLVKVIALSTVLLAAGAAFAQPPDPIPDASSRSGQRSRADRPFGLDEMLAKQRAARDKKNHEEMLERGDRALRLANQLEASYNRNQGFSSEDRDRLESLEALVLKIRKDLGGDDDDASDIADDSSAVEESKPSTVEEAFKYLQSTTVKLVDELKKTTRFSISAVAIQSSNTVLKIVKFLRLRR